MRTQELKWYEPFEKLPTEDGCYLVWTKKEGLLMMMYNPYSGGQGVHSRPCFYYYDSACDCDMEYPVYLIDEWAEAQ